MLKHLFTAVVVAAFFLVQPPSAANAKGFILLINTCELDIEVYLRTTADFGITWEINRVVPSSIAPGNVTLAMKQGNRMILHSAGFPFEFYAQSKARLRNGKPKNYWEGDKDNQKGGTYEIEAGKKPFRLYTVDDAIEEDRLLILRCPSNST